MRGILYLSMLVSSVAAQDTLDLSKIDTRTTAVHDVPEQKEPCNYDNCCERWDTVYVESMGATVYSFYRSGAACDPYLREYIYVKADNSAVEKKYHYHQFGCEYGDELCELAWRKTTLNAKDIEEVVKIHINKAREVY